MKYAVINERNGINRISDSEITGNPEGTTIVELSDEQASLVVAGRTSNPPTRYFYEEGELITFEDKQEALRASRELTRIANLTPSEKIVEGERHVENSGFNGSRLVTLIDILMQVKEDDALASHPKLIALYTWLQTVKGMALVGDVDFPVSPWSFEEVVSE